jgi:ammonia channel protein AmtB
MYRAGYFGLMGVLEKPSIGSARVPSLVFCLYQLMFAAITYVALLIRPPYSRITESPLVGL